MTSSSEPEAEIRGSTRFPLIVQFSEPAWEDALAEVATLAERALLALEAHLPKGASGEPDAKGEICVVLSDDEAVHDLNKTYRGKDKPTNVLSFPVEAEENEGPFCEDPVLGDVVLALETVAEEARIQRKSLADHTSHLLVHGFLHLLGYDHQSDDEAGQMEALERRILGALDIADPYDADTHDADTHDADPDDTDHERAEAFP